MPKRRVVAPRYTPVLGLVLVMSFLEIGIRASGECVYVPQEEHQ